MPLDFPLAPVNGEPYNAKNRKDPKEKAARSDINAGKRSSSLFGPRSEPASVDSIKREPVPSTKKTLEERIRPFRRCSILSRSLVE